MGLEKSSFCMATVAACSMIAATVGTCDRVDDHDLRAVQRYCLTSWRNAGVSRQDWQDCTQEALRRLLHRLPREKLTAAVSDPESDERRELRRAVWSTLQQWRRAARYAPLPDERVLSSSSNSNHSEQWDEIKTALQQLSERQRTIITLWSEGWSVAEIAQRLTLTAARVSDEKYKAIAKLRHLIHMETATEFLA